MARVPNLDDLAKLRSIGDVHVAPGGERIAYVVTAPDPPTSTIWIDDRPVAEGNAPRWLPDGSLAFVRDNDIRVLPAGTGESTVRVSVETGVLEHAWSADGTRVAYTTMADTRDPADPIVVSELLHKLDGMGRIAGRGIDVFVHDGDDEPRRLTEAHALISGIAWRDDDILFAAAMHDTRDLDGASDLHRVPAAGGAVEQLSAWPGIAGAPVVDDDRILFVGLSEATPMLLHRVFAVERGDGKPVDVFPDLDRNVMTGDVGYPGAPLQPDGRGGLVFCIRDHGLARLVRAVDGTMHTLVDGVVTSASVDRRSGVVATVVTTATHPEELVVTNLDGAKPRRITSLHDDLVSEWDLGTLEERWFTAADDTRLQGWLRVGGGNGPHPLLVDIHGGPHNAWSPVFDSVHLNHHVLAERGWAVLTLNPRASDGYGQAFWAGTRGEWGVADEDDFHTAIDTLVAEGIADPDRLAVSGYSYGGYMAAWLVGRTDRFAAAVAGGPVTDAHAMHGTSDIAALSLWREWNGRPWDAPDAYRDRSPITFVDNVNTPTLLLHGELDARCPVGESERFFAALRARGVPSQLVLYPGASHPYPISGSLAHRRDHQQRVIDWLVTHVEGPRPERPSERETRPERPSERETRPERPSERETRPDGT